MPGIIMSMRLIASALTHSINNCNLRTTQTAPSSAKGQSKTLAYSDGIPHVYLRQWIMIRI